MTRERKCNIANASKEASFFRSGSEHSERIKSTGIGLRHPHMREVLETKPDVTWFEVHTENFFAPGTVAAYLLDEIVKDYPLSCHGVGLSLGSADGVDEGHVEKVKKVIERYQPVLVSDHISWGLVDNVHLCDLLPIPYTEEALEVICQNIDHVQHMLGQKILVENPSTYLQFVDSVIPEWEFVAEISKRTGCGLLLDVNNIVVSCTNHDWDAHTYLNAIPKEAVGEIHIAGYAIKKVDDKQLLIDDHGARIYPEVWQLYEHAISTLGPVPTLIEWDTDVPGFSVLMEEKAKADEVVKQLKVVV